MKLITIKRDQNNKIYIDGNSNLASGAIFFFVSLIFTSLVFWDIFLGLIISILLTIVTFLIIQLNEFIGKRKHKSIQNSKLFESLETEGFKKEVIKEYHGFVKVINGSTVRIYYDWNKFARGFMSFGDIVINVFIEPLINNVEEKIVEVELIETLNYEYAEDFRTKLYIVTDRIILHLNYYPWTNIKKINKEINECISLFEDHNLIPMNIDDEKYKKYKDSDYFYPKN